MNLTRGLAASYIEKKLLTFDYDERLLTYPKLKGLGTNVLALLSRNIFGKPFYDYDFRENDYLTRYELAKLSLEIYAYLSCVEYYNLNPGKMDSIEDIACLKPLQRWYIHSAIGYGFVDLENNCFRPFDRVDDSELKLMLDRVLNLFSCKKHSLNEYRRLKLDKFKAAPLNLSNTSDYIYLYNSKNNMEENILASSIQGIVNRDKLLIVTNNPYFGINNETNMRWIYDYAISEGYIKGIKKEFDNPYSLLNELSKEYSLNSYIVYNHKKPFSIPLAYNLAAVNDSLIISDLMEAKIISINSKAKFLRIDSLGLNNNYEYIKYSYDNLFEYMRRDALAFNYPSLNNSLNGDYSIAMKIPAIWVNGEAADDYDERELSLACDICKEYPANIPIIGFYYGPVIENGRVAKDIGITEFEGVKLFGEYGKYTCVMTTSGNLSFFTGLRVDKEKRKFKNNSSIVKYSNEKKYVALCMSESGDSPMYIISCLRDYQWDNPYREELKFNYSYGLCNYDLLPLHTSYFAKTATKNNYFYGAISGIGYNYPLLGFGKKGEYSDDGKCMSEDDVLKDHYVKANHLMELLGFDALAIYERPERDLNDNEKKFLKDKIVRYIPSCNKLMLDMHRPYKGNDYKTPRIGELKESYFNNASFWSLDDLGNPNETSKDAIAVDYLYNEILKHTQDGRFFQCMALSWHYGPRRLKMVIDRFKKEKPEYEFVTVHELDAYFREYKNEEE